MTLAATLYIIGSAIVGLLGLVHLVYTLKTNKLDPRDAETIEHMQRSKMVLTGETTVWKAWIGFNVSHSLGAMLLPAVYIPLAASHFEIIEASIWFAILPLLLGLALLVSARKYWFKIPFTGILIASLCLASAALLVLLPSA